VNVIDPRASHAPEAYDLLCALEADVEAALPADLAALARTRIAMTLGVQPWQPLSQPDVAADFAEQFAMDVTGVELGPIVPRLGDALVSFVKALWVIDLGLRTDLVLARLFAVSIPSRLPHAPSADLLGFDPFLRSVARLGELDPLTTELVRLRVARHHNCRLCKSLRTQAAMSAGGDETIYDQIDDFSSSQLDSRQKTALQLTEAIVIRPDLLSEVLVS
jgi:AhpD family alkylhydroperoxidase